MGDLGIAKKSGKEVLIGVPLAQGTHVRFNKKGRAVSSPTSGKASLRGLPLATGAHKRFD